MFTRLWHVRRQAGRWTSYRAKRADKLAPSVTPAIRCRMLALWLAAVCALLVVYRYMTARPPGFPPGPPRLPLWGSYWFIYLANYRYTYKALAALGRLYRTAVLGLHIGPFPTVVLLDHSSIKEVFDNPDCQGRVQTYLTRNRSMGKTLGLIFTDGEMWKNQRRFMLRNMRDLGYARRSRSFEDVERQEVQDLLDLISGARKDETALKDSYLRLPQALSIGGANALCHAIFGDRFLPAEHDKLYQLAEKCCYAMREIDATGGTLAITPWLRHFGHHQFGLKGFLYGTTATTRFFQAFLEERKSTYDENSLRDFFDIYLHNIKQNEANGGDFFTENELLMIATDMMLPAIATMAAFTSYILLQLTHHPDIMCKAQAALDAGVGKGRLPTLDDRHSLPYVEAIIREALRHQTTAPLAVLRRATADTIVSGYPIPKDTFIITDLWAAHRDPSMWQDPDEFRPERFLDSDGNLLKKDYSVPFGGGKRVCVGETFARHHVFLFLTALLQNCSFDGPPPGSTLPCPERDVIPGLTVTPPDFQLRVSIRE